ncbi:MAG: hypothetical protein J7623_07405 [Chitinophaga sp.]|uniref:hypothetical protein n=1 Tax=Chitinophaga sp. TaxID=1869181 RepID=UPI001B185CD8|nr:hypothetical protein [Chitinophaga sp.]MBO9728451.1 hypothetical protein [Chitinophaga sp.]
MRNSIPVKVLALLAAVQLLMASCKKNKDAAPAKSEKYGLIAGNWQQKDIVFAVPVKLGGQNIPAGTSIIKLAPLLGPAGALFTCTTTNTYQFSADGQFAIKGCTDLILPTAGNAGTWKLDVHDAVFLLTNGKGDKDPHWIENVSDSALDLSITVTIPNVATAPLVLKLKK